jgi:geranylgeranyl pyrophosphate synthase|tara:strand:- start:7041 stop:8033 length:993 start_codon:yes stop_codon:yes gene_type:complete
MYDDDKIRDFLVGVGDEITDTMAQLLEDEQFAGIANLLIYQTATGGKRLRPALAILTTQALGGKKEETLELAATFEMIHQASLAVDDVVDGDFLRRGKPSTPAVFGMGAAVMGGTTLFSLAIKLGLDRNVAIGRLLSNTLVKMATGNSEEILVRKHFDIDQYLRVIRLKTASLFKAPCQMGAIVARANDLQQLAAKTYGENVGMMYQVADDLVDVLKTKTYDKPIGDMREGKVTYPVIHTYKTTQRDDIKETIEAFRKKKQLSQDDWILLFDSMDKNESIKATEELITQYRDQAIQSLGVFPDNKYTQMLKILPDYMKNALLSEIPERSS